MRGVDDGVFAITPGANLAHQLRFSGRNLPLFGPDSIK